MQTRIAQDILDTPAGARADKILRNCVHCGFCTATCPTYQLLGDELDGPRGRIYLVKKVLEGEQPTYKTMIHLDRCLTCRSCETTCPSGVQYAQLIDIGRNLTEQKIHRPFIEKLKREAVHWALNKPKRFAFLYRLASKFHFLSPAPIKIELKHDDKPLRLRKHDRKVLLLEGCVQPTMEPNINNATRRVLDHLGIQVRSLKQIECCGAISYHLNKQQRALQQMRTNIDAWWPYINKGYEAIISNASGCGITLKEYAVYLADDPNYAEKAQVISRCVKDVSELITQQDFAKLQLPEPVKVAFHAPCTLQHGLKLLKPVENMLSQFGFQLTPIIDSHLCCGSAGTYSVLQPELASQLKKNKLEHLQKSKPEYILTANIGCQHHLASESKVPVRHWIELVDELVIRH